MLPIGNSAPVTGTITGPKSNGTFGFRNVSQAVPGQIQAGTTSPVGGAQWSQAGAPAIGNVIGVDLPANSLTMGHTLVADLTDAAAATINQFRQAIMTQSILELDARGGTRYVEILRAHWNVISPDFRLQRPEYILVILLI